MNGRLVAAGIVALISSVGIGIASASHEPGKPKPRGLGQFYASCKFSHRAPDDSIVYPGQPGRSHLHDFFGNKTTNAYSTPESLRSTATNCHRESDSAAYWVPTLYEGENRVPVRPLKGNAFYFSGFRDFASIQPFPEAFQMIAGDASAKDRQPVRNVDWGCTGSREVDQGRSPDNSPRAQALRAAISEFESKVIANRRAMVRNRRAIRRHRKAIRRLKRARGRTAGRQRAARSLRRKRGALARKRRAYRRSRRAFLNARAQRANREAALQSYLFGGGTSIPTCAPDSNLTLEVRFPDCWDGRNLDSSDHKSHVAYSFQLRRSIEWVCPRSHPVLVPILMLQITYASLGGPEVRLSPGDVDAGHADFVNGWDQEKLVHLVRNCLNVDDYCGGGSTPRHGAPVSPSPSPSPSPAPQPSPSPSPSPAPQPSPSPAPTPQPQPEPDPNPLPIPLP